MQATEPAPQASQADALVFWLRLDLMPGVGRISAGRLIAHFQTPQAVFAASADELATIIPRNKVHMLKAALPAEIAVSVDAALAWATTANHAIITLTDCRYPAILGAIPDPPLLLYCIGRTDLLAGPALAMVGSRNATVQGQATARAFAQSLSEAGLTVVSGLAAGIDAAAHEGALRGIGSTVAVMGTGADRVYPARNRDLAHAIAATGCLVSEYALGTPPASANFPRRNRIISGLACGVLVVEAAAGSGSLITAGVANDQGRDVFAIPGSIHSPLSKGCHHLIKQGATLVECAADLLDALRMAPLATPRRQPALDQAPGDDDELLTALGYGPVDGDTLALLSGMSAASLASRLLTLELSGQVERLPGGVFQRVKQ